MSASARERTDALLAEWVADLGGLKHATFAQWSKVRGSLATRITEAIDTYAAEQAAALRAALEAIINASDGCQGHRGCNHSMEPWQRARILLAAPEAAP